MLKFSLALQSDGEFIKNVCENSLAGVEAYTHICMNGDITDGSFFCGKNSLGEIESIVFNNKDEYKAVFGTEFSPLFDFSQKSVMVYSSDIIPTSSATEIHGTKIFDIYRLMNETDTLSYDSQLRYVYRVRCSNSGFAKVFAVKDGDKIISTASVSGKNEKYALISDVFSHALYRNKGNAKECVNACIGFCLSQKLTPYLLCEEKMQSFYKKLGFVYYGKM